MPTWPVGLPQYVNQSGFSERLPDNAIETEMDFGPAKGRRRFTTNYRPFSCSITMTPEQVATFEAFWKDTLASGVLSFDWVHPRTRVAGVFKFRRPPPTYTVNGEAVTVAFTMMQLS